MKLLYTRPALSDLASIVGRLSNAGGRREMSALEVACEEMTVWLRGGWTRKIAILFLLWSMSAFADSQLAPQEPPVARPSAIGKAHACGVEWYPPAALAAGEEGTTTVSFRIGVDGSTNGITIVTGSGFADLDDAAVKCVAEWKYQPATQDGRAQEVDWKANVEWSMAARPALQVVVTRGTKPPPPKSIQPAQQPIGSQVCKNPMAPPAPLGRITVVMFWIMRDGTTRHLKLVKSSGDDKLDELALACASKWQYTPLPDDAPRAINVTVAPIPW